MSTRLNIFIHVTVLANAKPLFGQFVNTSVVFPSRFGQRTAFTIFFKWCGPWRLIVRGFTVVFTLTWYPISNDSTKSNHKSKTKLIPLCVPPSLVMKNHNFSYPHLNASIHTCQGVNTDHHALMGKKPRPLSNGQRLPPPFEKAHPLFLKTVRKTHWSVRLWIQPALYPSPHLSRGPLPSEFERKTSITLLRPNRNKHKNQHRKSRTCPGTTVRGVVPGMATVVCQKWRTRKCRLLEKVSSLVKLWCCLGTLVDVSVCHIREPDRVRMKRTNSARCWTDASPLLPFPVELCDDETQTCRPVHSWEGASRQVHPKHVCELVSCWYGAAPS